MLHHPIIGKSEEGKKFTMCTMVTNNIFGEEDLI